MKTHISLNLETQKLHQSKSSQEANETPLEQRLERLWLGLVNWLTCSSEVRVWQTRGRHGLTCWHGYNPVTGCQVTRFSEAEMIDWIEQNYHLSVQHNSFRATSRR